ncbi:PaaI family thioesterase [Roseomonas sp. HF4]|uniref:PaaI family thioesterase n=1 Tax=Roseomonas sp. HF4 TaxID=2562313 RepID=UPI00148589F2|nr:PaaI family thioesterase [Roseomonas sp. HF4]
MTDAPAPFDPAAHGWKILHWHEEGFPLLVGPFWSRKEEDGWSYGLVAEPRHGNAHGIIHGGMLVTFLDQILGVTCWEAAQRTPVVTIQLNTHFVSGAKAGDFLVARAEAVRATRSVVFVRGQIMCGERIVATADGVWKRLGAP